MGRTGCIVTILLSYHGCCRLPEHFCYFLIEILERFLFNLTTLSSVTLTLVKATFRLNLIS